MKKSTIRVTIVCLVLIVGVVSYYLYLSQKSRNIASDAAETKIQRILSRDLEKEYPPTPKEVVKYFTEIQKCLYGEECTAEEIEELGMKARELFDPQLQEINQAEDYIPRLIAEIETFHTDKKQIVSISLPSSVNVDEFEEDGYKFARLYCKYSTTEQGKSSQQQVIYLLRRDEGRRWKIYGWDRLAQPEVPGEPEGQD